MGSSNWSLYFLAGLLLILTKQFSSFRGMAIVATVVNVALLEFIRIQFFTYNTTNPPLNGSSDGDALLAVYLMLS